jgi:hypothetical protein
MRRIVAVVVVGLAPLVVTGVLRAQQAAAPATAALSVPPAGLSWAYGIAPGAPYRVQRPRPVPLAAARAALVPPRLVQAVAALAPAPRLPIRHR